MNLDPFGRPQRPGDSNPKAKLHQWGFLADIGRMWHPVGMQLEPGDLCRWCARPLIRHDVVYVICPVCDQPDATPLPDVPPTRITNNRKAIHDPARP